MHCIATLKQQYVRFCILCLCFRMPYRWRSYGQLHVCIYDCISNEQVDTRPNMRQARQHKTYCSSLLIFTYYLLQQQEAQLAFYFTMISPTNKTTKYLHLSGGFLLSHSLFRRLSSYMTLHRHTARIHCPLARLCFWHDTSTGTSTALSQHAPISKA